MNQPYNWSAQQVSPYAVILSKEKQAEILATRDPELQKRAERPNVEDGFYYQQKLEQLANAGEGVQSWKNRAACRHVPIHIFFPKRQGSGKQAKQICADCQVRESCLEFALAIVDLEGIWGGTSKMERKLLRKERKQSA